jgi:hypothetical protein
MKYLSILFFIFSTNLYSSVIGISSYPLHRKAQVVSAEMTGFMGAEREVGMGLRYLQKLNTIQTVDVSASGGQERQAWQMGAGLDFKILAEEGNLPRLTIKPYWQYQKIDRENYVTTAVAPTISKGFVIQGYEFYPYVSIPSGIRTINSTNEFTYLAAANLGAVLPVPDERLLLSFEANRNFGASTDYLSFLVSWIWN